MYLSLSLLNFVVLLLNLILEYSIWLFEFCGLCGFVPRLGYFVKLVIDFCVRNA